MQPTSISDAELAAAARHDQAKRIGAEAAALISDLGDGAYSEARSRARQASSDEMEREWNRVALAIPSEAVREVSRLRRPARAICFRLIDRDGQEVFGRDRR